jgi:hypothetical protein
MKNFFIFFLLLFSITIFSQDVTLLASYQKTVVIRVDINQPWTNSGLVIEANDKVDIVAKGVANSNPSNTNWWCGPEGLNYYYDARFPLPYETSLSLIAKIGENGSPFFVGRGISFISNISGDLYFGYNDYYFDDNEGYYVAFVCGDPVTTDIEDSPLNQNVATDYKIEQNYPNPFNPSTIIEFRANVENKVSIVIYNANGELVKNLFDEFLTPGLYTVRWDGTNNFGEKLSSGTYYYRIKAGGNFETKKMILLK